MPTPRKFKLPAEKIVHLIDRPLGFGIASDHIMVEGRNVGYMYREEPDVDGDSGWRFFSGAESQEYADDASHFAIYALNTIANSDREIIPYLESESGTQFERVMGTSKFRRIN